MKIVRCKQKNNTLSEKIKELELTIRDLELNLDFHQDMNMWKKTKKPPPRKEITPPIWGKINMNNKYDSLLDLDRLSESDEPASNNSTDSPS